MNAFIYTQPDCMNSYTISGGYSEEETPVPIPNTAVKLLSADGTAWAAMWESRSPPDYTSQGPIQKTRIGPLLIAAVIASRRKNARLHLARPAPPDIHRARRSLATTAGVRPRDRIRHLSPRPDILDTTGRYSSGKERRTCHAFPSSSRDSQCTTLRPCLFGLERRGLDHFLEGRVVVRNPQHLVDPVP